ncbi:MAG TPA: glycoside hydrolase family 99-like domain-containing protein [Chthonomonadales bacterium]|nr:glycoside hydrolase family 99-like domain-containing protein [Chthonomonadales bacterium]
MARYVLPLLVAALLTCATHSARADRLLREWRFDTPERLAQWRPNTEMRNVRIENGALRFRCEGADPQMIFEPWFEVPASAFQAIELEIAASGAGNVELFWSGTREGPHSGLDQSKLTLAPVQGGMRWQTVRVYPFWHNERRIVQLRIDPYDGAEFALRAVRIVEATAADGAWPIAQKVAAAGVAGGARLTMRAHGGFALARPVDVDAEQRAVVAVRLASSGPQTASVVFATDRAHGLQELRFPVTADGRMRVVNVDMLASPAWLGRVQAMGLRPGERAGDAVTVESLRVVAAPQGPPDLRVVALAAEQTMPRAGRPFPVVARVQNGGGAVARAMVPTLALPAGGRIVQRPAPGPATLAFAEEAVWRWMVRFDRPGRHALRVSVRRAGGAPATGSATIPVHPPLPARTAIRPPRPVRGPLDVGVYYFPGWRAPGQWAPITRFPERRPALGWYREGEPEIADWHVRWAVEHGITFFAYCWYWVGGDRMLEHALHDGLFMSRHGNLLRFCLLWANHNPPNTTSREDLREVTRFWIQHYFRRPEYKTVDGKPVVIIFQPSRIREDLPPGEKAAALEEMRAICREAGLPGLYLIAVIGNPAQAAEMGRDGYDAVTAYTWPALGTPGGPGAWPWEGLLAPHREWWQRIADTSPIPILTPVNGGWDARPWHGANALVRTGRTPALFRRHLADARRFVEANPARALPMVLVEAWNEWGEGSYIEPHQEFGFGYLDAIRSVFAPDAGPQVDLTPEDAGVRVPTVQVEPVRRRDWTFDRSMEDWMAMMFMTNVRAEGGAWSGESSGVDPAILSPPLALRASECAAVEVRMRLTPLVPLPVEDHARLFWSTATAPVNEAQSVSAPVRLDGEWRTVRFTPNVSPRFRGAVTGFRFDPCNHGRVRIEIDAVRIIAPPGERR